jgi:hypothetical protein
MNARLSLSSSALRLAACLCALLWLAGCASVDWNARVGHYTYQQAVLDMGPPDREAKLADGTTVGEWLLNRGTTYVTGGAGAYGPYGPFWGSTATAYTSPNLYVRLTFSPDGQMISWKKIYR